MVISGRSVRIIALSVTVSVALGTVIALTLGIAMGGMPARWELRELVSQVPLALFFCFTTSVWVTVPLGLLGGLMAVFALRHCQRVPQKTWMARGCLLGATIGFVPFAVWDIVVDHARDALIFPVLCGMGGGWAGAIVGSLLNRFHTAFAPPRPGPSA
jgi:hypothetical protein